MGCVQLVPFSSVGGYLHLESLLARFSVAEIEHKEAEPLEFFNVLAYCPLWLPFLLFPFRWAITVDHRNLTAASGWILCSWRVRRELFWFRQLCYYMARRQHGEGYSAGTGKVGLGFSVEKQNAQQMEVIKLSKSTFICISASLTERLYPTLSKTIGPFFSFWADPAGLFRVIWVLGGFMVLYVNGEEFRGRDKCSKD